MRTIKGKLGSGWLVLVLAASLATQVQAADRRFMPVPQGSTQSIQVINGMPILSAVGKQFQAATTVSVLSSKQGRLMVSIKNQTAAPVNLEPQAVVATSAGQVLSLRDASDAAAAQDKPASRKTEAPALPAPRIIKPGEVFATQYFLELPRKQRGQLSAVLVTVEIAGERLNFDFKEVE